MTRALEKLRAALVQKGVPVSSVALAAALVGLSWRPHQRRW